ncbi:CCR3 protein, partial [Atractosteus spatula]|nr:CCR3 protein [Atractosteus spatula]
MKKVTNIFILNLAISDLVFASSLPFWVVYHSHHWIFGSFMCKLISGVYFIGVYSSLIFLTVMSVDRYLTVVHSVSIALRKRALCAWSSSAVIWTITIAASIKEMVISDTVLTQDKDIFICEEVQTGITPDLVGYCLQIVFLFLLPFLIIVFCYCSILKTVIACTARAKYNAVKIIFGIVVAFFICWAPYNLVMFLMSLNDLNPSGDCDRRAKLNLAFNVCRNLAYFHCCLNPLLYVCTAKYRAHLRRLVCNSHPFADATKGDSLLPAGTEDYIHIRIQQRNGRKTLTTVQGIATDYDKKKLVKAFKKKFACNGTVIEHPEYAWAWTSHSAPAREKLLHLFWKNTATSCSQQQRKLTPLSAGLSYPHSRTGQESSTDRMSITRGPGNPRSSLCTDGLGLQPGRVTGGTAVAPSPFGDLWLWWSSSCPLSTDARSLFHHVRGAALSSTLLVACMVDQTPQPSALSTAAVHFRLPGHAVVQAGYSLHVSLPPSPLIRGSSHLCDGPRSKIVPRPGYSYSLFGIEGSCWQCRGIVQLYHQKGGCKSRHSSVLGASSVMDVLEFRHDDPEELLLDLGFGMEEPDISIKIPARFINYASQARGINIQVFLQAQKTRMDIENPDFRIRFRQLEVLQQVTSAFSSLVHNGGVATQPPGPAGGGAAQGGPPDAKDKRTKVGMLFRWASKKTISLGQTGLGPSGVPESAEPPETAPSPRRPAFKRARPCLPESASLSPLEEELGPAGDKMPISCPEDLAGPVNDTLMSRPPPEEREPEHSLASETGHRVRAAKEPRYGATRRKQGGDREPPESFEMEEIHSFDEGSISGSITAPGAEEILGGGVIRTNSCQSDSSGFLEEPFVPSLLPQSSPAPEVLKALHTISGDSIDSQSTLKGSKDLSFANTESEEAEHTKTPKLISSDHTDAEFPVTLGTKRRISDASFDNSEMECEGSQTETNQRFWQSVTAETMFSDYNLGDFSPHPIPDSEIKTTHNMKDSHMQAKSGFRSTRSVTVQMPSNLASFSQNSVKQSKDTSLGSVAQTFQRVQQNSCFNRNRSDVQSVPCLEHQNNVYQINADHLHRTAPKHGMQSSSFRTKSMSLDTGLDHDERQYEEVVSGQVSCCCRHEHHCSCCSSHSSCTSREHHISKTLELLQHAYTLEELEGLIRSLRKFRETFVGIEEQLGKEQISVYDFLSDIDKEEVRCIQELRTAVKEQVNELELQLADLAFNYDEGLNMQVHRLLDEQSYLHAQLKIKTPENQKSTYSSLPDLEIKSTRSVSTQCSLLPEIHLQDILPLRDAATMQEFLRETGDRDTHPVEDSTQVEADIHARESTSKALKRQEKVDFLAFLQNVR